MMITEAIRKAGSEHTICALLTAYVATMQFSRGLPERVRAIPMLGIDDLKSLLEQLVTESEAIIRLPDVSAFNVVEAANVFDVAIDRINKIQEEAARERDGRGRSPGYSPLLETQAA